MMPSLNAPNHRRRNAIKTVRETRSLACAVFVLCAFFLTTCAGAASGDFYPSYLQAKVIAHLPMSGGARQMFLQRVGRRQYLYVQQPSQIGFTIVDLTKPTKPNTVSHVPLHNPPPLGPGRGIPRTR